MLRRIYLTLIAMVVALVVQQVPAVFPTHSQDGGTDTNVCAADMTEALASSVPSYSSIDCFPLVGRAQVRLQVPSVLRLASARSEGEESGGGRRPGFSTMGCEAIIRTCDQGNIYYASQLHGTVRLTHVPPCDYYVFTLRKLLI